MNRILWLMAAVAVLAGCTRRDDWPVEAAAPKSDYVSPEALAVASDGTIYVTGATAQRIIAVSPDGAVRRAWEVFSARTEKPLAINPTGIAAAPGGGVWVTGGVQNGELHKYDANGALKLSLSVGHSPCAPTVTRDGAKVYLLNRFKNRILAVDASSMKITGEFAALREPFAAALGAGEKLLFVGNLLPCSAATNSVVAAAVTIVDLHRATVRHVSLPNGSTGVRGMAASPDGAYVYVTHTMGRYQLPTTQLERGWMNTAALSVFNGSTGEYVNTVLLDDIDRGGANPWGVAVSGDGKRLVVAHAGTCEASVIDRERLHERLADAAKGVSASGIIKSAADVPNDLAFLVSIRRRVALPGDGPRGVAVSGDKAVAALYFADALATVKLNDPDMPAELLRVGPERDLTKDRVRRGEMLFNDGSMCFQQWQSCASCHPDGRVDALNWDLLNDGVGNPKQTKSELYVGWTPPTMVTGIRKDMNECNRAGLIHIQFVTRPEEDVKCLDEYCLAMKPVPSPYLVNGRLSALAERGKELFARAKCDKCHTTDSKGPGGERLWTDCAKYDVGLGVNTDSGKLFDTPTLAECWRTAPYLYDGRALTMKEVLTTCNPDDKHGETQNLSDEEIDALAEYVLSL